MRLVSNIVIVTLTFCLVGYFSSPMWADEAVAEKTTKEAKAEEKKSEEKTESQSSETKSEDQEAEVKPNKVRLAHIKITGELPESVGEMSFFGDLGVDLRKTIARLDKAAEDKKIAGVILEIGPAALSRGKLNELREAVGRVRAAGKKVYAQMEAAMSPMYQLAVACDEIAMPEAGVILIPGVRAEFTFMKDMLEKIGLEADMMHVGDFKGAAEPLTRNSMSEPVRKNRTAMIEDLYDQLLSTIAADRHLKIETVRELVDQGLLTAAQAKEVGLIDHVIYPDEFREQLKKQYEADKLVYVVNYGKKKVDTDFSGPMGMIKLFQTMIGAGSKKGKSSDAKVAIVYAVGPIGSGKSQEGAFGRMMGSDTIVKALREAGEDENVKAVVLRINSPGGSALASDLIWRATQALDIPVIASMGDVAASGGYYIAMGADRIIAEPGTITGSIGVVGGKFVMSDLYDKIGMSTEVISRGANTGVFSTTEKFSKSERKVVKNMMQDVYKHFTSKAAEGRDMSLEKLEELAGGQIYTGRDAKRIGLVDELGTLQDAIQAAKQMAGLDPDNEVKLEILPEQENPFEAIFGADLDAEREAKLLAGVAGFLPELKKPFIQALQWRQLMQEPVMLIMPYSIEIK